VEEKLPIAIWRFRASLGIIIFNKNRALGAQLRWVFSSKTTSCESVRETAPRRFKCYFLRAQELPIASGEPHPALEE
jgi:hypothetical protein